MAAQTCLLTLIRMLAEEYEKEDFDITIHKHGNLITTSADVPEAISIYTMTTSIVELITNLMTDPKVRDILGDLDEEAQDYAGLMHTGIMDLVRRKSYEVADDDKNED